MKCQDKLLWRFQYDKYKPINKIATCQSCRQKCITKAYRTFCDPCSVVKQVCPGCCCFINTTNVATMMNGEIRITGKGDKGMKNIEIDHPCEQVLGFETIADTDSRLDDARE